MPDVLESASNRNAPAAAAPDDPPPYEIVNPDGTAPFVLTCDHASRALPAAYGTLGLDEAALRRHIAWDIGAADVTRRLAALLDAPAVLAGVSRLFIDCNRPLDDPTSICESSDGVTVPGNRGLDATERARRAARYFHPYHDAVDTVISRARSRGVAPALIAVHSFTPIMNGVERPWHIGVLWDHDPRIAVPLMAWLRADHGLTVGDNQPYSAKDPPGYGMARHGAAVGLPHVLLEIRQDLIDTHHGAESWANLLAATLRRVADETAPFSDEPGGR